MKLFAIAAAVILCCIHSSEAAAPRLRPILKGESGEVVVAVEEEVKKYVDHTNTHITTPPPTHAPKGSTPSSTPSPKLVTTVTKTKERTTAAAEVSGCRERISQYVSGGQMFFIVANQTIVYENPSTDPFTFTNIYWMCQPTVAPDLNGDGMYDSVASRVNIYIPPKTLKAADNAGATGVGKFTTHGYTASWVKQGEGDGGYYNELVVDFGDTTVWQINGKEFIGYETSPRGTTGGMVTSGEGLWTTDTSNPLLQDLAKEIGKDLTAETCAERYAETWEESHASSIEVEE